MNTTKAVMSEKEFLAAKGVSDPMSGYCLDKLRGNRNLRSVRGRKRFLTECEVAETLYQAKRNAAKLEYKKLLENGKVRAPSAIEKALKTAHGHPDNPSVQAARRMLCKRGIDWVTGNPIC